MRVRIVVFRNGGGWEFDSFSFRNESAEGAGQRRVCVCDRGSSGVLWLVVWHRNLSGPVACCVAQESPACCVAQVLWHERNFLKVRFHFYVVRFFYFYFVLFSIFIIMSLLWETYFEKILFESFSLVLG